MKLDTRSGVEAFANGFRLMDAFYDKEEDRERRDDLDQERRDYRDRQLDNQDRAFEASQEQRQQQQENWEKSHEQSQKNADRSFSLSQAQFKQQQNQQARRNKLEDDKLQRDKDMEVVKSGYQTIFAGGDIDENTYKVMQKYPHLAPNRFLDPEFNNAIDTLSGAIDSNKLSSDEELLKFANQPEMLNAFNKIYAPQIDRGDGGSKRIVEVYPGQEQGTLTFELEVTTKSGEKYLAPMTVNRGTDLNDPIKQISLGEISKQLAGYSVLNNVVKNPEYRAKLERFATGVGFAAPASKEANWSKLDDGSLFNKKTGEVKLIKGRESSLTDRDKEELKTLRSRYTNISDNAGFDDSGKADAQLMEIEERINDILRGGQGESSGTAYTPQQQQAIQAVMQANPDFDQSKAISYLKHINRW